MDGWMNRIEQNKESDKQKSYTKKAEKDFQKCVFIAKI